VPRSLKAHLLLLLVTFFWGTTFVLVKSALGSISPFYFNALRMTLATACLGALYWRHLRGLDRTGMLRCAAVGIFLALGYEFQTAGLVYTTPSKSAFITGLSVVIVPVIMALAWRKMVRAATALGVAMALAGLYLMTVPADGISAFAGVNRGDLLTLGCAVAFAAQIVLVGHATRLYSYQQVTLLQTAAAALLMWGAVPAAGPPRVAWSGMVIFAIVFTAVVCTAAAFLVQSWAQQFTPPTHTALIFATEPVFAGVTSYILLGERLGWRGGLGAALILAGVLVSELKGAAAQSAPSPLPEASISAEEA
jgi:drug/metabolite transporter (DMT)-like permease